MNLNNPSHKNRMPYVEFAKDFVKRAEEGIVVLLFMTCLITKWMSSIEPSRPSK
jgi:hypothetical protein